MKKKSRLLPLLLVVFTLLLSLVSCGTSVSDIGTAKSAADTLEFNFYEVEHIKKESKLAEYEHGDKLSGGQRQRTFISRAVAGNPEILVLDDASSALDYQTDANLRRALRENYRNTTTVLVAQRVSSLRHADLILVLDDGNVIGMGNHAQLMESCEEYRIIAQTQMGERGEVA